MLQWKRYLFLGLLLSLPLLLLACSDEGGSTTETVTETVTRVVEVEVAAECPEPEQVSCPECPECPEPEAPAVAVVPFEALWLGSPHADATAEAFIHWDEDDPAEVPTSCAKCHSTPGYLDFLGADGSEAGVVDAAAPIGTVVECAACHNDVTIDKTSVIFPSGVEVTDLGDESRCMECHQGRSSKATVDASIAEAGLGEGDLDTVSEDLGFTNIHYYAAAATQYGTITMGGYEYDGNTYDARFEHVEGYSTCNSCHDPHTLEVDVADCVGCHTGVESVEDLANVRMAGSLVDYDGDGDMAEGVAFEIDGMRDVLYDVIQAYAAEVAGTALIYDSASYPYFFIDSDGDGATTEGEANFGNRYNAWTPRLAKAAYNYQVSLKDPGRYAHGGKYIIQLLYDSIEDVNGALGTPVDVTALRRIDHGHFAGSEEAFRHWDEDGAVPGRCSRCHSADGLPLFATEGVSISQPISNGFQCATCHSDLNEYTLYEFESVTFPSGLSLSFGEDALASNLCLNCHQGRASGATVENAIGDAPGDEVVEGLNFINVHYFAAGATVFGTEAQGMEEFPGQTYFGRNEHVGRFDTCTECHNAHQLEVEVAECADCHENVETKEDLQAIRVSETDFDGDGDVTEGLAGEIATLQEALYATLQSYSTATTGNTLAYNSGRYPYFFIGDADGNPTGDRYASWTPNMLRGAYNYQYVAKDPGASAHNGLYVIQVLIDSIDVVGGDTSAYTRPAVPAQ
jgi:hypothetical protein